MYYFQIKIEKNSKDQTAGLIKHIKWYLLKYNHFYVQI